MFSCVLFWLFSEMKIASDGRFYVLKDGKVKYLPKGTITHKEKTMKPLYKIAFTGHRPEKIGGYKEDNPLRIAVKTAIKEALLRAVAKYTASHEIVVISGGALGVDTDAARAAHSMGLRFVVAAPCLNQDNPWPADSKATYRKMCGFADADLAQTLAVNGEVVEGGVVYVTATEYTGPALMQTRNVWMVDHADAIVAVWNGSGGGTANCVTAAKEKGIPIVMIDPRKLEKDEEVRMKTPACIKKHEVLSQETQDWLREILERDVAPFLETDISSYAPGRQRVWMPYEAPLDNKSSMNKPFMPKLMHDELWQWIVNLCAKWGMKAQTALISKGGNIKAHRDTTYAAEWAFGINLGACEWGIASDRESAKVDYIMNLNGGEVFSFNSKHVHQVQNAAPDRWAINVWAIADTNAARSARIAERIEEMLAENPDLDDFIRRHQPGAPAIADVPQVTTKEEVVVKNKKKKEKAPTGPGLTLPTGVKLNYGQAQAFQAAVHGKGNILLTGNAGTGKSFLTQQIIMELDRLGKSVLVTATTGIAATHINGKTYHSALRMFPRRNVEQTIGDMTRIQRYYQSLKKIDLIIIDEISMMHKDELDRLDKAFKMIFDASKPFGGKRFMFVGDFLQVEPVDKAKSSSSTYVFHSDAWKNAGIQTHQLTQIVRQQDATFAGFLNNIRRGIVSSKMIPIVQELVAKAIPESGVVRFVPTNAEADAINNREMSKLTSKTVTFEADDKNPDKKDLSTGQWVEDKTFWDRNTLTTRTTDLKVGATVINLWNHRELVNGDTGVILEINENTEEVLVDFNRIGPVWVGRVKFHQGKEEDEYRSHIPLKPAWAITIHKSQGMTLDSAIVSTTKVFADGQCYVALSRVRTMDGLYLTGFDYDSVFANPDALAFYGLAGNLRGQEAEDECCMPDDDDNPDDGNNAEPQDVPPTLPSGGSIDTPTIVDTPQVEEEKEGEAEMNQMRDARKLLDEINNSINTDEEESMNTRIVTYVCEPLMPSFNSQGKMIYRPWNYLSAAKQLMTVVTNCIDSDSVMQRAYFNSLQSGIPQEYHREESNMSLMHAIPMHGWHYPFLNMLESYGIKFKLRIIPKELYMLDRKAPIKNSKGEIVAPAIFWIDEWMHEGSLNWTTDGSLFIMDIYDDNGNVINEGQEFDWSLIGVNVIDAKKTGKRMMEISRIVPASTNKTPNVLVKDPEKENPEKYAHLSNPETPFDGCSIVREGYLPKSMRGVGRLMIRAMIKVNVPTYENGKIVKMTKKWTLLKGDAMPFDDGMECEVVPDWKMPTDKNGKPYDIITHSANLKDEFVLIEDGKWANRKPIIAVWPHHDAYSKSWEQQAPNNLPIFLPVEDQIADLEFMIKEIQETIARGEIPNYTEDAGIDENDSNRHSDAIDKMIRRSESLRSQNNLNRYIEARGIDPRALMNTIHMAVNGIIISMKSNLDTDPRYNKDGEITNPMYGMHRRHPLKMRNAVIVACSTREFYREMIGWDWNQPEDEMFYIEHIGMVWTMKRFDDTFLLHGGDDHDDNHTIKPFKLWTADQAFVDTMIDAGVFPDGTVLPKDPENAQLFVLTTRSPNGAGEFSFNRFNMDTWPTEISEIDESLIKTIEVSSTTFPVPMTKMMGNFNPNGLSSSRTYSKVAMTRKDFEYSCIAQKINPMFGTMCNVFATYSHLTGGQLPPSVPVMLGDIVDATQQGADIGEFAQIATMPVDVNQDLRNLVLNGTKLVADAYVAARRANALQDVCWTVDMNGPMMKLDKMYKLAYEGLRHSLNTNWSFNMRNAQYLVQTIKAMTPDIGMIERAKVFYHKYMGELVKWDAGNAKTGFKSGNPKSARKATKPIHDRICRDMKIRITDQMIEEVNQMADKDDFLLALWWCILSSGILSAEAKHGTTDRLMIQFGSNSDCLFYEVIRILEERHIGGLFNPDYDAIVFTNKKMVDGVIESIQTVIPSLDIDDYDPDNLTSDNYPNKILAKIKADGLIPDGANIVWFIKDGAPKAVFRYTSLIWRQICSKLPEEVSYQ